MSRRNLQSMLQGLARSTASGASAARLAGLSALVLLTGCASVGGLGESSSAPAAPAAAAAPSGPVATSQAPAASSTPSASSLPAATTAEPAREAAPASVARSVAPETVQRAQLDHALDRARTDLWERVRAGFSIPDLDDDLVRKWEQFYAQRPDYVQRMTERGGRYLFHIVEEVERRGLPMDLALLPFIESAFNPQALSRASASGIWQFMPATGKDFELRQNLFRDDRRDVLASTNAALDYLSRLNQRFDDWHLALAAYNWGQGNVSRALQRLERAGRPQVYTAMQMPQETREYVRKLQAVKNIVRDPARFGLSLPPLENHPFFVTLPVEQDIDVALVARLAGVSVETFQQLNPQHNKPVIVAAVTAKMLLPYDNANQFLKALEAHRGPLASWTAWVAPRTLNPAEAAKLVGMPESELREVNRIPARMMVRAGSTLLVHRTERHAHSVAEHIAEHARLALTPEPRPVRRVTVRVGNGGTTVAALARRHGMRPEALAQLNGLAPTARLAAGQRVQVEVRTPPRRAASATPRQRPSARPVARTARDAAPARPSQANRPAPARPSR